MPYLENEELGDQVDDIQTVNRENVKAELQKSKVTVLSVFAPRCHGCSQVEPQLASVKKHLASEFYNKVEVVKMDINNEVFFLKNVSKTPSFLIYEKKGNYFWDLDMKFNEPLSEAEIKSNANVIPRSEQGDALSEEDQLRQIMEVRLTEFIKKVI